MQNTNKKMMLYTFIAYAGFLISWGIGQALSNIMGESGRCFSLLFFFVVYMALFGIATPLYLAKKFGFKFHSPISKARTLWGVVFLALFLVIGVFFSDALPTLSKNPPTVSAIAKYFLLFLPMALGISLYSTFLLPRMVVAVMNRRVLGAALAVIVSALSLSLGFLVDSFFSDIQFGIVMLVLGLFLGVGSVLTRSIMLTYPALFVVVLINTLSEAKYYNFGWLPLIIGFLVCCAVVFCFLVVAIKGRSHHSTHLSKKR